MRTLELGRSARTTRLPSWEGRPRTTRGVSIDLPHAYRQGIPGLLTANRTERACRDRLARASDAWVSRPLHRRAFP
jgi:hypothetical protein